MRHFLSMQGPMYRILTRFVELIVLNGLFLLFCIPLFTIGAATTALYSVTLKMVRNEESGVYVGFWQAFKKNFKQSTRIWIMLMFAGLILFLDLLYLEVYEGDFKLLIILSLFFFTCIHSFLSILIFPYVARFKNTIRESVVNAMKIAITNPIQTIPVLILSIGPVLLIFVTPYLFVLALYLSIFFGFSLVAYLNSFLLRNIYEKY